MKNKEQIIIKKSEKALVKVENFIEEVCERYNINDNYFGNFVLAVTELFKIVMKKDESDDNKDIVLIFETKKEKIEFIIKDCIFKEDILHQFQNIDNENYLIEPIERSIFLIKTLCDEIEFRENEIRMIFAIEEVTKSTRNSRQKAFNNYLEKKRKTH